MSLMPINSNNILFKRSPRKNTISIYQAQQMYQHHEKNQHSSRIIITNIMKIQISVKFDLVQIINPDLDLIHYQYQYQSPLNRQYRSPFRSNHECQNSKPYDTHRIHYNNNRHPQDSRKKIHSRSPSYSNKLAQLPSRT